MIINGCRKKYLSTVICYRQILVKIIEISFQKYIDIINERSQLFGQTCEHFANEKSFLDRTLRSLFYDADLTSQLFKMGYADADIEDDTLTEFFLLSQGIILNFKEVNLQKIAVSDFFQNYFSLCEDNTYQFYGKPIVELTFYQARLASWGKTFKFLLSEHNDWVTDDVLENPVDLIDFHWKQEANKKREEKQQKTNKNKESGGEFVSVVGASASDIKEMENIGSSNEKKVDLWEKAESQGGELNVMDLLEMQEGKKFRY